MTNLEPYIHRKVLVMHRDDTVGQAAHAMSDKRIGCVLVTDHHGHVVGIATDRDLVSHALAEGKGPDTPLSEVMTPNPVHVDEGATLQAVIQHMVDYGIRRIPVIQYTAEGMQKCVGIVTLDDLLAAHEIDWNRLMRIVRSQVIRRAQYRPSWYPPPTAEGRGTDIDPVQARNAFLQIIREKMAPKADFSIGEIEQLSKLILDALSRRLHHTAAIHLTLQLPRLLQEELLEVPVGPDRSVTTKRLSEKIGRTFDLDDATSYAVLTRFCMALEELMDTKELDHVKAQLPDDFRMFFGTNAESRKRRRAA